MKALRQSLIIVALGFAFGAGLCEGQQLSCVVTAPEAPPLRTEGLSEPIGDLIIKCLGSGQAPSGQSYLTGDIQLKLNTNVVNRLGVAGNQDTTDAVLVINDNNAPPTTNSTLGGPASNVPVPQFGKLTKSFELEWGAVQIPIPGAKAPGGTTFPSVTTIRITNVRCNAFLLGFSSTLVPTQVTVASLAIADAAKIQGTVNQVLSGLSSPGMFSGSENATLAQCQSQNIVNGRVTGPPTLTVNIYQASANVFRPLGQPSLVGAPHSSEDGYPTPGIGANGGGADQGTRILLRFNNVPDGVRIAAPGTVSQGALTLQLTQADVNGNGSLNPATGNGLIELPASGTTLWAVYEVTASDGTTVESTQIPFTVGYVADQGSNLPEPGIVTMNISFAPLSNVDTSGVGPFPSFGDTSVPQNAFIINPCLAPPPSVDGVSPNSVAEGLGLDLVIQVSGSNFDTSAMVEWNGSVLSTFVLSPSTLSATVPANLLMEAATVQVDVLNPDGQRSHTIPFTIVEVGPAINSGGIVNAASSMPTLARGSLATIFGTRQFPGESCARTVCAWHFPLGRSTDRRACRWELGDIDQTGSTE